MVTGSIFSLPPYTREKKAFGHCWDRTRASCVASDRVIHYSMPLGRNLLYWYLVSQLLVSGLLLISSSKVRFWKKPWTQTLEIFSNSIFWSLEILVENVLNLMLKFQQRLNWAEAKKYWTESRVSVFLRLCIERKKNEHLKSFVKRTAVSPVE